MKNKVMINTRDNELKSINEEIVAAGQSLPLIKLKDGTMAQTGTVGAMLANILIFNKSQSIEAKKKLELAVPTLIRLGMFDLFSAEEWISDENLGRTVVGKAAKQLLNP